MLWTKSTEPTSLVCRPSDSLLWPVCELFQVLIALKLTRIESYICMCIRFSFITMELVGRLEYLYIYCNFAAIFTVILLLFCPISSCHDAFHARLVGLFMKLLISLSEEGLIRFAGDAFLTLSLQCILGSWNSFSRIWEMLAHSFTDESALPCYESSQFTPYFIRAGPIMLIQAVVPHMVAKGKGKIVNVGSISCLATGPFTGAYASSKAALQSATDALR